MYPKLFSFLYTLLRLVHEGHCLAEGRRVISWIWRASDAEGSDGMVDSLRVEWLKARARVMRWREETKLLPEEMRRCLATLLYEEHIWRKRARDVKSWVEDPTLLEGLISYAIDQASIRRSMRATFRAVCLPTAQAVSGGSSNEWEPVEGMHCSENDVPEAEDDYLDITRMYELDGEDLERPQWA